MIEDYLARVARTMMSLLRIISNVLRRHLLNGMAIHNDDIGTADPKILVDVLCEPRAPALLESTYKSVGAVNR